MKNRKGEILYIGKAVHLKRRVSSYFTHPHDTRIQRMVSEIAKIETKETDSALEALILESALIKKHQPPFNVQEKDDKSFLYVAITADEFPRILLIRGKDMHHSRENYYYTAGPFVSASSVREALRIIRKIFPWNDHLPSEIEKKKACFNYQIQLCPGVCVGDISKNEYKKTIKNIVLFFEGKKEKIVKNLEKEMNVTSKKMEFEKAEKIKRQLFALKHINDTALFSKENFEFQISNFKLKQKRIEGYDISNISGTNSVGVMVVFEGDKPEKNEYRKFHIKTIEGSNDTGMLKEVIERRFRNNWKHPDLILVDGGLGQVNAIEDALKKINLRIPVIGMAKGVERKRTDIIGKKPLWVLHEMLVRVRDEAHRFAIAFHRKKRRAGFLKKS
ncbi:MAG: GIY-YIG nuclease family protein [Patescibacteria group bacterium]